MKAGGGNKDVNGWLVCSFTAKHLQPHFPDASIDRLIPSCIQSHLRHFFSLQQGGRSLTAAYAFYYLCVAQGLHGASWDRTVLPAGVPTDSTNFMPPYLLSGVPPPQAYTLRTPAPFYRFPYCRTTTSTAHDAAPTCQTTRAHARAHTPRLRSACPTPPLSHAHRPFFARRRGTPAATAYPPPHPPHPALPTLPATPPPTRGPTAFPAATLPTGVAPGVDRPAGWRAARAGAAGTWARRHFLPGTWYGWLAVTRLPQRAGTRSHHCVYCGRRCVGGMSSEHNARVAGRACRPTSASPDRATLAHITPAPTCLAMHAPLPLPPTPSLAFLVLHLCPWTAPQ